MNLALLDIKILQLINQYSINGSLTPSVSNQDYLLKTRNLIDACQKELASIRKIPTTHHVILTGIADHGETPKLFTEITLPTDFKELKDIFLENEYYNEITDYIFESKKLLINSKLVGNLAINYYKNPTTITKDTLEATELEIDEDIQELIPYYVGGWIYLEDNPTIATMLLNEYERKISRIQPIMPISPVIIENVFQGFM